MINFSISLATLRAGAAHSSIVFVALLGLLASGCGDDSGADSESESTEAWVRLAAGKYHSCGLRGNGEVVCWGKTDMFGIPSNIRLKDVSAYGDTVCGVSRSGQSRCFGLDLEEGGPGSAYQRIYVSSFEACGLLESGGIDCWGIDDHGLNDPPAGGPYVAMDISSNHACALDADGGVDCWGLGSDSTVDESTQYTDDFDQAVPPTTTGFTELGLSRNTSCAIKADGAVQCWGETGASPAQVPDELFAELDGSANNMCGITVDGRVLCWGITDQLIEEVPSGEGHARLAVGSDHACAVHMPSEKIVCWGIGSDPDGDDAQGVMFTRDYDQAVPPA